MKKKVLEAISVILFICMLFVLTGCSNETNIAEENNVNSIQQEELQEVSSKGVEIKKITQEFTGRIALVEDEKENQYVIDENGKVIYSDVPMDKNKNGLYKERIITVSNGYFSVNNYGDALYDCTGKEITKEENKLYGNVSKSGYIVASIKSEDVSGTKYVERIEDLKGNKISEDYQSSISAERGFNIIHYLFEDFYVIYTKTDNGDSEYLLMNAKTKEISKLSEKKIDGYNLSVKRKNGDWYYVEGSTEAWNIKSDFSIVTPAQFERKPYNRVILNKYLVNSGDFAINADKDVKMLDFNGNEVKDFSEIGGIRDIEEYNNVIYVITTTGYIYTMDADLNYIIEPRKTEFGGLVKTQSGIYGLITSSKDNPKIILLNDKLEVKKELTNMPYNYISYAYSDEEKFIYALHNYNGYIYNLDSEKVLEIYK